MASLVLAGNVVRFPGGGSSLAYLGTARAAVLAGDRTQARDACQAFFSWWKDADADLPPFKEAHNRNSRVDSYNVRYVCVSDADRRSAGLS